MNQAQKHLSGHPTTSNYAAIWALAWPSILTYLLITLTSLTLIKILGDLGTSALAAGVTGQRVYFVFQAMIMGLSAGTTAMVAQRWGARDFNGAAIYTHLSLWAGVGVSIILSVLIYLLAPALANFFALSGESYTFTVTYIRWLNFFNPAFAVLIILSASLRAIGNARLPLYIGVGSNLLVILFSIMLTYGVGNFDGMGVIGPALGSGLGYACGALALLLIWRKNKPHAPAHEQRAQRTPYMKNLARVSYPAAAEQLVMQGALIAFLWLISHYGTEAFVAYGIGLSILSVAAVIGLGFSVAGAALVGQRLGADDPAGAQAHGYDTMKLSLLSMTLLGIVAFFYAEPLASSMTSDPEVIRLVIVFIVCFTVIQPLLAIEFSIAGSLRGAGDTMFPLISAFCGFFGVRIAFSVLFMQIGLPIEWLFATMIGDYLLKSILLLWRFRSLRWIKKSLTSAQQQTV